VRDTSVGLVWGGEEWGFTRDRNEGNLLKSTAFRLELMFFLILYNLRVFHVAT